MQHDGRFRHLCFQDGRLVNRNRPEPVWIMWTGTAGTGLWTGTGVNRNRSWTLYRPKWGSIWVYRALDSRIRKISTRSSRHKGSQLMFSAGMVDFMWISGFYVHFYIFRFFFENLKNDENWFKMISVTRWVRMFDRNPEIRLIFIEILNSINWGGLVTWGGGYFWRGLARKMVSSE